MKRATLIFVATLATLLASSCGNSNNPSNGSSGSPGSNGSGSGTGSGTPNSLSNLTGAWEFTLASTTVSNNFLVGEANFPNSTQPMLLGFNGTGMNEPYTENTYLNGLCPGTTVNSISATMSGNSLSFSVDEGGNTFTGKGNTMPNPQNNRVTGTGTYVTGTYSETSGTCPDSGTFIAKQVPSFDGQTFTDLGCGQTDSPSRPINTTCITSLTVTEKSDYSVIAGGGKYISSDYTRTPVTLSGYQVGNLLVLSGYLEGQMTQLYLYRNTGYAPTGDAGGFALAFDVNGKKFGGGQMWY